MLTTPFERNPIGTTTMTPRTPSRRNTRKIMLSLGAVGAAAAIAGMGTFGTFTSTTSGSQSVASGTVRIDLGGDLSKFVTPITNIVAGDVVQRAVTLTNSGSADLNGVTLTTKALTGSLLDSDTKNGVQMKVEACVPGWKEDSTHAFSCTVPTTTVLAARPIVGADLPLSKLRALTSGQADNLLITATLPQTADNAFQNQSSVLDFSFTGTQRTATNR